MTLQIIPYEHLLDLTHEISIEKLNEALLNRGIVGISDVPHFHEKSRAYIYAARQFAALSPQTKENYSPNRDAGDTGGYELGAEWFQDENSHWQIDGKKASYYARVPDHTNNRWPQEVDLKTPYLALAELIFQTGKCILNAIGVNESIGIHHAGLTGYGRMLHYHKENDATQNNPNWCGAHFDHGIFTGIIPAYYFRDGEEVEEPEEAGLFIMPNNGTQFEKIHSNDKSILLFQVGEFGQLATHDRICATKHLVRKASGSIERFTFALFYAAAQNTIIKSQSTLTKDTRYSEHMSDDGSIIYAKWNEASLERYRARQTGRG